MPQPNMKKEYRAELRKLKQERRWLASRTKKFVALHRKRIVAIEREILKELRAVVRLIERTNKRIAILEGRLS